ncbi:MAG: SRPBCC family protein [Ilumatobacteraceae bacterium]
MSDDVTTTLDHDRVSASTVVDAAPDAVFDFLRRPANHALISGDGSVRGVSGDAGGDEPLQLGDRFGMKMKLGVPYRIRSKVVELEPDHVIAWAHVGGHRWRWTLTPEGDGQTLVTETFDMSTAKFPPALRLVGYPARHRDNVSHSVENLAAHFAGDAD